MSNSYISLDRLPIGCMGRVKSLTAEDHSRRRMLDLGLISGTVVEALRQSPSGDPVAYQIRGAVIALRSEEAANILVELV
jgi:ferrous iron transport protein A